MSPEQQIETINSSFNEQNKSKYMAGQAEHGGDFFTKPTIANIREEAVDLINYTHVLTIHRARILNQLGLLEMAIAIALPNGIAVQDMLRELKHSVEQL
jgi:hypothetical protein